MPLDPTLDPINLDILKRLAVDGRVPFSALARDLRRSTNTVVDRAAAMERRKIISGYRAVIDDTKLGKPCRALILLEVDADASTGNPRAVLQVPGLRRAYQSIGHYGLMVEVAGADPAAISDTVCTYLYPLGYKHARILFLGEDLMGRVLLPRDATGVNEVAQVDAKSESQRKQTIAS